MSLFGVQINTQIDKLNLHVKLTLANNNHSPNIRTIRQQFLAFDPQQNGLVSVQNFQKALQKNSLHFKVFEIQIYTKYYSEDGKRLNWYRFLTDIKTPLNPKRRDYVNKIFSFLAGDKIDSINIQKLKNAFNVQKFQDFKLKKKSQQTLIKQFFDLLHFDKNNTLSRDQFINFYDDLNVNLYEDLVFYSLLSSTWGYTTQIQKQVTPEAIKYALRQIRFKLIQKTPGPHQQYLLRNLFDSFDPQKRGSFDRQQLHLLLIKLQTPLTQKLHEAVFNHLDRNKSGAIEYRQLYHWMFFDEYPL